jgi:hypothetical protein
MMKKYDVAVMKAVSICFKQYLKPEEAMIYCDLGRTQLSKKCSQYGIYKNKSGYYKREDLDLIISGAPNPMDEKARQMKLL